MTEGAMAWPEVVIGSVGMLFVVAIVVVLAVQLGATWRARTLAAREDAYRQLAVRATEAQEQTARRLDVALAELAEVRTQTEDLRKLLREVEEPWNQ